MNPDLDQLEQDFTTATRALEQADLNLEHTQTRSFRVEASREAAVAEREARRLDAARDVQRTAQALEAGVRAERTRAREASSGFSTSLLQGKTTVAAFWASEIREAPVSDLVADLRAAIQTDDRKVIAAFVRFAPRRLADQPAATFTADGFNRPGDLPDQADRDRLRALLTEATAHLAPERDDDEAERLETLQEAAAKALTQASRLIPRDAPYRFQQPGDIIQSA